MDTVLETGPGVWEQRAHADQPVKRANIVNLIKVRWNGTIRDVT